MALTAKFSQVEVVILDLDDTLCGYWDAAKKGLKKSVECHFDDPEVRNRFHAEWVLAFREFVETLPTTHWYGKYLKRGDTTRFELMRRTLERLGIIDDALANSLSHTYHVERHAQLSLFPDSLSFLDDLKQSYKLGLLTNGPADIQRQEIQKLRIEDYFDLIQIEGEMGFGKPDPRVYEVMQDYFKTPFDKVLMVGNSYRHDIKPAIQRGLKTAWVKKDSDVSPTSSTGRPEEIPNGSPSPDIIVGTVSELLEG